MAKQGDVVLVDDDEAFREFLNRVLEQAGYATASFATAEEARLAIDERRPDVLLSDVRLPGMSGYELCREVKEAYGDAIAVVLVSGERTEPFDRAAGIFLGADDYLVKPFDTGELVARVWRLVARTTRGRSGKQPAVTDDNFASLTAREHEVLGLLANGSTQDEIADTLYISPRTVATHIQRVLSKLEVRSRAQAVALALRHDHDVDARRRDEGGASDVPPRAAAAASAD